MNAYRGFKKLGLITALGILITPSVFGQQYKQYKDGFYSAPDRKAQCLVVGDGETVSCKDKRANEPFNVQLHNGRVKFFDYKNSDDPQQNKELWEGKGIFQIWPAKEYEILVHGAKMHGEDPGKYVLEGSAQAKDVQERAEKLAEEVIKTGNLVTFK